MKYNYCIIGTGRQGTAAAYDILKFAKVENLLLIDNSEKNLEMCFDKLVSNRGGSCKLFKSIERLKDRYVMHYYLNFN